MSQTFIILDGHPSAFNTTVRLIPQQQDPTVQVPLYPLWASIVQSTIEFCRIAWDVQHNKNHRVNVLVAGGSPFLVNDSKNQNLKALEEQFPHAQPRQTYTHDRMQPAIETALRSYLDTDHGDVLQRCRIVLISIAKQPNEKTFEFYNNPTDPARDIRSMVYQAVDKLNNTHAKRLNHVEVDVLRLLPYCESLEYPLPPKILSKRVSSQITMSVYNIPNGQEDLRYAMHHLAQLYYNIHVLHISNIPMKSAEHAQSTQTVTLYYQANGYHLINQQEPLRNLQIHDPTYLKYRELKLAYSKRSKRALPESEWCTCMHSISPLKNHDLATEVFLDMTLKGSISYLVTPENSNSKRWTHILMAQEGVISLHCLNSQLQQQFEDAESNTIQLSKVKTEGFVPSPSAEGSIPKTIEFLDTIIQPNLFENVEQFLHATAVNPLCSTVPLNPSRFSHHLPIMHSTLNEKGLYTSRSIEKATRWRTCFRDCEGTDRFPIVYGNTTPIEDLAVDVLNGTPRGSGFGIVFGLIRDLFEQLQDVVLKDSITAKEVKSTKELATMMVKELVNGMEGAGQKLFVKGIHKEEAKLVSKKLLVAFCLVGKRFMKDSDGHRELCEHILSTIANETQVSSADTEEGTSVKAEDSVIDNVWGQVSRYEDMSLREREDAALGILPDIKPDNLNKSSQTRVNVNFKSRRRGSAATNNAAASGISPNASPLDPRLKKLQRRSERSERPERQDRRGGKQYLQNNRVYPDPSVAKPYLTYIAPTLEDKAKEEKEEENSLGKPGNLLWLYWMNDKIKKRGNQEEGDLSQGTELVYKNHQWKRVKKEFLGRLAHAGEEGETM